MTLADGGIELWHVDLDSRGDWNWLSHQEKAYAAAAMDPAIRRRRVAARSALRDILGRYLGVLPTSVPLDIRPGGKPVLPHGPPFNLSHCRDVMLVAVSGAGEVGVDIEALDRLDSDWRTFAAHSFSMVERAEIAHWGGDERLAALRTWVRKEAYAKARGAGYAYGFPSFTVRTSAASSAPILVDDTKDPEATTAWRIIDLVAPTRHFASLAHAGLRATVYPRDYN